MRSVRLSLVLVILSLAINGCSHIQQAQPTEEIESTPRIVTEGPHFRGEITKLFALNNGLVRILAEGHNVMNPAYVYEEAAAIDIRELTKLYQEEQQVYRPASGEDLAVGQTVEVYFSGPIEESWPVHGTAGEIVIMGEPSTNNVTE